MNGANFMKRDKEWHEALEGTFMGARALITYFH